MESNKGISTKIRKLIQTAQELRQENTSFNVTRLSSLKSLCQDAKVATQFALYILRLAKQRMDGDLTLRSFVGEENWQQHCLLVEQTITEIERFLERPTSERWRSLRSYLPQLKEVQGWTRHIRHRTPIRVIHNQYVLMAEKAVQCATSPEFSDWCYHLAREYAERYDPRYGTGLLPESAPMVEDIAEFWCQHYFEVSVTEKFG